MKAISGTQMRKLDRMTIEQCGISGEQLMETAGRKAAECIADWICSLSIHDVIFFAGKGKTAGDAFVAARILEELGIHVSLRCIVPESELKGDALTMFQQMPEHLKQQADLPLSPELLNRKDVILIDGLLGTGFHGQLRETYRSWCQRINASGRPVATLDLPSGLDADSGEADPDAVYADITFTMAAPKTGMFSVEGIRHTGRLKVLDIGIPADFIHALPDTMDCIDESFAAKVLKREPFDCHKNYRGHLFVIGGSKLYPGAPLLASDAALHSGAGLVTCLIPEQAEIYAQIPKALILRRLNSQTGYFNASSTFAAEKATVIAAGPGIGTEEETVPFLAKLMQCRIPLLLDADALNLIASYPELAKILRQRNEPTVLTPHPGEMKRLCQSLNIEMNSRTDQAIRLAEKLKSIVVLKGARTIVAAPDGRYSVNLSGCAALATAGTGDLLSGMIGTMLMNPQYSPMEAVQLGVFLHGVTAEYAAPAGSRGWIADDFPPFIGDAIRKLNPTA